MFPHADPLLILAVVVVAGLSGGALARRLRLAGVTGQILAGVAIGHAGLQLFQPEDVAGLQPVTQFALGLITVMVGGHLNVRRLRNARKRLGLLLLGEVVVTPLVVYAAAHHAYGASWPVSALLAAMAISTAPATVVAVVSEARARGVFVKTLMNAVVLNNIACIAAFEVARLAARVHLDGGLEHVPLDYLVGPLRQIVLAALVGAVLGGVLVVTTRRVFSGGRLNTASLLTVLLAIGLARGLAVSPLLACLFLGVTLANLTPNKDEIVESAFVNIRAAIFAVFFTLAGMHLDVEQLGGAGLLVVIVVAARTLGKAAGARVMLTLAGATERMRRYIGLALVPQAGVAVGLLLVVQDDPLLAPIAPLVLNVGLAVVAVNEIIGPFCVRYALVRSGEAGQDRERLIDFLHEENIVTDLRAGSKEEAIEQLVGVLIRSNRLDADRDELLASVLARERDSSTCLGAGLAVPHGILPARVASHGMVGAMGISREGLAFDTPDGVPVHCMVVLATPPHERDRHLQVLAALARSVGSDPNVRRQLVAAESAAHAYEILHLEEARGFNYFLGDEEGGRR